MCNCGSEIETTKHFCLCCQFLASERHNLHDVLFLIDPPVTSFDGESLLNPLLCGSDEFNDKINKKILLCIISNRADDPGVAERGMAPTFLCSKNKKEKQWIKRTTFKIETINRPPPR